MEDRREVRKSSQTKTALGSIILLVILVVFGAVLSSSINTQAAAEPSYKYYTTIQVRTGDTLWDIADSYMTDNYKNIQAYIEEVCSINHISDDTFIRSGQYLTIPYYSKDYLE